MNYSAVSQNGTSYELCGSDDATIIVFIHGLGLNRQIWRNYLPFFSQYYRVLSYDLHGHGKSSPPPKPPDLGLYATQLRELLDELEVDKVALIGFSLGGMINRRFAFDYRTHTSALVILNAPHKRTPEAQKRVEKQATDAMNGPGKILETIIRRWFTAKFRQSNSDYIQQIRDWLLANDPVNYALCRQVLATGVTELINPEPPLTQPTLVMTCENDSGSPPAMSFAIANEIKGAETIIVPQLQHMGLVEQPSLFIEPILNFLHTQFNKDKA